MMKHQHQQVVDVVQMALQRLKAERLPAVAQELDLPSTNPCRDQSLLVNEMPCSPSLTCNADSSSGATFSRVSQARRGDLQRRNSCRYLSTDISPLLPDVREKNHLTSGEVPFGSLDNIALEFKMSDNQIYRASTTAPVNIAVIK